MSKSIGKMIETKRVSKKMTREQLAKKLDITPGYLGQLENDSASVYLSERVEHLLESILSIKIPAKAVENHNAKVRKTKRQASTKTRAPRARRRRPVDKSQGILPNFLAQMDTVKIEELMVQRLFEKIQKNVNEKIKTLIDKVG